MIADIGCTGGGVNLDHIFKRFTVVFAWAGIVTLVLMMLLFVVGARFNTTKSIPLGLYWASSQPVEKGVYVMFCPPQDEVFDEAKRRGYIGPGSCPGGYGYMMKRILAAKGDVVTVNSDGVVVNDKLLPLSLPVNFDKEGRALPYYRINRKTLTDDEVMMMTDVSSTSFDSRYFGPVLRSQIKTVIIPVVTW